MSGLRDILVRHRDRYLVEPYSDHTAQNYIYRAMPELVSYFGNEVRALNELQRANIYLILHKPMSYLHESLKCVGSFWMPNDTPLASGSNGLLRATWAVLQLLLSSVFVLEAVVLSGGLLLFRSVRRGVPHWSAPLADRTGAFAVIVAVIIYTAVISSFAGIGSARYREPVDILMVATIFVGGGIWSCLASSMRYNDPAPGNEVD
jgi:hypothetical protein